MTRGRQCTAVKNMEKYQKGKSKHLGGRGTLRSGRGREGKDGHIRSAGTQQLGVCRIKVQKKHAKKAMNGKRCMGTSLGGSHIIGHRGKDDLEEEKEPIVEASGKF